MKPNRYYEHKQHAFDSYCKKVLKCEACNGYRQISRHQKRFASLEELSEADVAQLAVYDRYSWEYTAFPVGNPEKTKNPEVLTLDSTYRIGNRSFIVEPVFKEESSQTLGEVLLRLMKSESEKL